MKPRSFTASALRNGLLVAAILVPFAFLCGWLGWSIDGSPLLIVGVIAGLLFFAAVFGMLAASLNPEKSRLFHFSRRDEFIAEMTDALQSKKFTLKSQSPSSLEFSYRMARVVVQLDAGSAVAVGPGGILDSLRLPSILTADALERLQQGQPAAAVPLLEEALWQKPGSAPAREALLEAYNQIDGPDQENLKAKPIPKKRMLLLYLDLPRLNQIARALEKDESIDVLMGDSSEQKTWKITREDLLWLVEVGPLAEKAYQDAKNGNTIQALHGYKQALKLSPGCDLYLMNVGAAYAMLDQKEKAVAYLERAAAISPGNSRIQEALQHARGGQRIVLITHERLNQLL